MSAKKKKNTKRRHENNSSLKSLKEELELYRKLSDEAADAICMVDLSGKILYANKAQARLLKSSIKKIKNTHFREYVAKDSLAAAYKFFNTAKHGQSVSAELNIVDSKGKVIPIEFHSTPLYQQGKVSGVHAIVRDIRLRKDFEDLQKESEVLEALNHFVAGVAQEIKYPLKGISSRLDKILKDYQDRAFEYIGYKEFSHIMGTIESVKNQVKYCFDTTHRLLNLNRKKLGALKNKCDANDVIKKSITFIDEQFMQDHTKIKLRLSSALPTAAINESELSQVIINILTNAIQSMPTGGIVRIQTSYNAAKNKILIKIKDQGIGIKKENLSKIFDPFYTTKQRGLEKSSGLGLSIVHSIVQAHHGKISVKSSLKHGTHITMELPRYNGKKVRKSYGSR